MDFRIRERAAVAVFVAGLEASLAHPNGALPPLTAPAHHLLGPENNRFFVAKSAC
jgi:hypothetical protein